MGSLTSRQEVIHEELSDARARDWLCMSIALREATHALAVAVHQMIGKLHRNVSHSMAPMQPCNRNCSQINLPHNQWCGTCYLWRAEIIRLCQPRYVERINWSRYHSSLWPTNAYEFARVFIPRAHRFYFKSKDFHEDIRFTLSFLENCRDFGVSEDVIRKAWTVRSSFRRKGKMRLKRQELDAALDVLENLLSSACISNNDAVREALKKVLALRNSPEDVNGSGCCIL